jgi:uncharacterized protein YfdQ (DUF2303 family)
MPTEAETIADLARKSATAATVKTSDGREFLISPDGATVREVSDEHSLTITPPRYIRQGVTLQTQDSLVEYVNRYKSDNTVLFANIDSNAILATIDYHAKDKAAVVAHRATLTLPFSEEWGLWTRISGKLQSQLEFARFLEENGADVRAPDAAELLEACRDLQAHRKVNFTKAVRTSSENETFEYQDETKATTKAGIELPTKFKLGIPVYFGEPDTELFAFLRWAIDTDKGGLSLGIALHRAEHVRQAVFKQIVTDVANRTSCVAVFGKI